MYDLVVSGHKLAYISRPFPLKASQPALLFVHGTGGDSGDWQFQLDHVWGKAAVVALDLPGHGASYPGPESSVPAYADRLTQFVQALGLQRVVVVGCSLGGAIALWLAVHPPEWLAGIALVGAGSRMKVHPAFLEGVMQDKDKALEMLSAFALANDPNLELKNAVLAKFLTNPAQTIHADLAACNGFDVGDKLAAIVTPTLMIVGEQDKLTPVKYSKFLHESISGSTLAVIPDAGHLVMLERPEVFNAELERFLASVSFYSRCQ